MKLDVRQLWFFLIGSVLALAPILATNWLVSNHIEQAADRHLEQQAIKASQIVEGELRSLIEQIRAFASATGGECSATDIERMRTMTLDTPAVSLVATLDRDRTVLCTAPAYDLADMNVFSGPISIFDSDVTLSQVRFLNSRTSGLFLDMESADAIHAVFIPRQILSNYFDRLDSATGIVFTLGEHVLFARDPATYGVETQARIDAKSLPLSSGAMRIQVSIDRNLVEASFASFAGWATVGALIIGALIFLLVTRVVHYTPARVDEIERAIANNEFVPFYQPVIDIESGKLVGCEVLVRWLRRDGSMVSPGAFIGLAEQTGLAIPMTRKLMRSVVLDLQADYAGKPGLKVAINLFNQHFTDLDIIADIEEIFGPSKIQYSQVVLEITERAPLESLSQAKVIMRKLQRLGCRLALDDAGTGHGGLAYLQELGLDIVKIDKMFIDQLGKNRTGESITHTLTELAQQLDMDVVAEGVETIEQVAHLKKYGIRHAQGYLFAPALPARQYLALVKKLGVAEPTRRSGDRRRETVRKAATIRAAAKQLAEVEAQAGNHTEADAA